MIKTKIRDLKLDARILMEGKYSFLALVTLMMAFFDLGLNYLLEYAFPTADSLFSTILYLVCTVLCNVVYYLLFAGMIRLFLNLCRHRPFLIKDLFSVFSDHPEPVALYSVLQFILQTAFSYSFGWCISSFSNNSPKDRILPFIALILSAVVVVWIQLSLSLVLFLYCDSPWKSVVQLIRESWSLMQGNKGRMFYLYLSFIGMLLLSVISLGIGLLFVRPYLYTVQALFYLDLM